MFKLKPALLIFLALLVPPGGFSTGCVVSPDYGELVRYEHRVTSDPNSIHIASHTPGKARIALAKARRYSLGRETVSFMSSREKALLAINAGFFVMEEKYSGIPAGMLKIRDEWYGIPRTSRAVLGWKEDGTEFLMDQMEMNWTADIGGEEAHIHMVNTVRNRNYLLLYTPAFNSTTMTAPGGLEIIVRKGRVISTTSGGSSAIPEDGFVLSYGVEAARDAVPVEIGMPVRVRHQFLPVHPDSAGDSEWKEMDYLIGGAGLLIFDGKASGDYAVEKLREGFDSTRHPRTAVGINGRGEWVFVVVDGRQPGVSVGMTLEELTELMLSLDCRYAINLDGGGSTTMFLNGSVVNSPSDVSGERPVADALMVLR